MRIKIIQAEDKWELEEEVNKFLQGVTNDGIIDIKYQGVGNHSTYSTDRMSVMIILKR